MPEIEIRSRLDPSARRAARKRFRYAAERAAKIYDDAIAAYSDARRKDKDGRYRVGDRAVKRIPVPPYMRPHNLLKGYIYALAFKIERNPNVLNELERFVRLRDRKRGDRRIHRPRNATAVDWVIRLVTGYSFKRKGGAVRRRAVNSIGPTLLSHWAVELNFALEHEIAPEFALLFIDHVGGHELISAGVFDGKCEFTKQKWYSPLRRILNKEESYHASVTRYGREKLSTISGRVALDSDDDDEA